MPSLFVIQGFDQGKRFLLSDLSLALGRGQENSIRLQDTEVSRRHATLDLDQATGEYRLHDLASSNGTYVNGNRVEVHTLRSGDRIQLGSTMLIYTGTEDSSLGELADTIDILPAYEKDESRIVRSMGNDDESIFEKPDAFENQWLARARSNLQVMYRTALAVSHTMDIDQLLRRILELIFEWVEADRGCIMLYDRATGTLQPKVRHNRPGIRTDDKMAISRTILDYVMEHREGVLTSDASDDSRWDAGGSIVKLGVREAICVPMQGRYGTVGIVYIDTYTSPGTLLRSAQQTKFNDEHLKLMIAIGHQAALAVEDTSYYSAMVHAERLAAIGQTIAGLSHHIKNILQGISGGSYLIEEGLRADQPDLVRKGWGIVERNQERISRLVLDMLTFSKDRVPDAQPADLNDVAAEVVELMQVRAAERDVVLHFRPAEDLPTICFDSESIHHAILNVVTNAIDACENCGEATVQVSVGYDAAKEIASVQVEDNGRGIPPEDQSRIFHVFESTKGTRGTGLGLSVSQKILREHGGDILVQSEPGRGSLFTLQFPTVFPAGDSEITSEPTEAVRQP